MLAKYPPAIPSNDAVDLLVSVGRLQRYLDTHGLSEGAEGGARIDANRIFGKHVRDWFAKSKDILLTALRTHANVSYVTTSPKQLCTCALCDIRCCTRVVAVGLFCFFIYSSCLSRFTLAAHQKPVSPIVNNMQQRIKAEAERYERVVSHWPMFGSMLEAVMSAALRETITAVCKQCGLVQANRRAAPDRHAQPRWVVLKWFGLNAQTRCVAIDCRGSLHQTLHVSITLLQPLPVTVVALCLTLALVAAPQCMPCRGRPPPCASTRRSCSTACASC